MKESLELAAEIASGPTFAHAMTKKMLHAEWNLSVDAAIDAEADAQAICMQTRGFPPRLPGIRGQAEAAVSGKLTPVRVRNFLEWPFFEPEHRELAEHLDAWAESHLAHRAHAEDRASVDAACRALVRELGLAGWTRYSVPYAAPRAARNCRRPHHSTFVRWR